MRWSPWPLVHRDSRPAAAVAHRRVRGNRDFLAGKKIRRLSLPARWETLLRAALRDMLHQSRDCWNGAASRTSSFPNQVVQSMPLQWAIRRASLRNLDTLVQTLCRCTEHQLVEISSLAYRGAQAGRC